MTQKILEINNISVRIGRKTILKGIDLDLVQGESVLIAGSNGAGKTTLLKCLAKVIIPDTGSINYSEELSQEKIGYISDKVSLFENWTLKKGIKFHKQEFRIKDFDFSLIKKLNMNLNQKIKSLSAGERVLFHLSLVLAQKPQLLLIDEIIHTIDPYIRDYFLEAIIDLMDNLGSTVIMINHTFSEVEKIPERLLVMDNGKFILDEKSEILRQKVKKVISKQDLDEKLPCIFTKDMDFAQEYYIYPFEEKFKTDFDHDFIDLNLNDIMKAFIGGHYA